MAIYTKTPRLLESFEQWVDDELTRIEKAQVEAYDVLRLRKLYAPPSKLEDGLIAYADGTSWNPGSGVGVYVYKGSSWVLLG